MFYFPGVLYTDTLNFLFLHVHYVCRSTKSFTRGNVILIAIFCTWLRHVLSFYNVTHPAGQTVANCFLLFFSLFLFRFLETKAFCASLLIVKIILN